MAGPRHSSRVSSQPRQEQPPQQAMATAGSHVALHMRKQGMHLHPLLQCMLAATKQKAAGRRSAGMGSSRQQRRLQPRLPQPACRSGSRPVAGTPRTEYVPTAGTTPRAMAWWRRRCGASAASAATRCSVAPAARSRRPPRRCCPLLYRPVVGRAACCQQEGGAAVPFVAKKRCVCLPYQVHNSTGLAHHNDQLVFNPLLLLEHSAGGDGPARQPRQPPLRGPAGGRRQRLGVC